MRYNILILDIEEPVLNFTWDLRDIDFDDELIEPFVIEVINFILEYAADKETAKGSLEEYIREMMEMYTTTYSNDLGVFKAALEDFCDKVLSALVDTKAYDDLGHLCAKFEVFHGNSVVLKRMTEDELTAYTPLP